MDITARDKWLLAEADFYTEKAREAKANADKAEIELSEFKALAEEQSSANTRNRILDFGAVVNKDSIAEVIDQVSKWVRQDPKEPVTIRFNSPGGEVTMGLALYDYLRGVVADGTPVNTVCMGMAASMAGILLQAGSRRVVTPNSYFLIHEVQAGSRGSLEDVKNQTAFMERLNNRLVKILCERSNLKPNDVKKRIKTGDWVLDSDECKALGVADDISHR